MKGEEFGVLLRQLRATRSMTVKQLASRSGMSAQAIYSLERGKRRRPRADTVGRLADAIQLSQQERDQLLRAAGLGLRGEPAAVSMREVAPVRIRNPRPLVAFDEENSHVGRSNVVGASVAAPLGGLPAELRGREELLGSLHDHRGLVVLTGMGGVGKSTLAAELARRTLSHRQVWWISAATGSSLSAGIVTVARRLGAREVEVEALANRVGDGPDRLWALLEQAPYNWLLVFDNADEPHLLAAHGASVADNTGWVRTSLRGLVLVTSRVAEPATWGGQARVHRLRPLNDWDAAQVLRDLAPEAGDDVQARALGHRLGGLPLALHLAGSHLGSGITHWSSFVRYERALDRGPGSARLLDPDPGTARAGDPRAIVMRTWELSLDDLARHGLPHARVMLRLLACLAPSVPISLDLLGSADLAALLASTPVQGVPYPHQTDLQLERTLRGLARLSLVDTTVGQRAVTVHPVIADTNRAHLLVPTASDVNPVLVWETAVRLVTSAIVALDETQPRDWPLFRELTPHVFALLDGLARLLDPRHLLMLMDATSHVVIAHHWNRAIPGAIDLTRAALAHASQLTEDHSTVLTFRNHVAYQTLRRGRWREAEIAFQEVLHARRRVLSDDHSDTLITRHQLAEAVAHQGRWAEAEAAFREVLVARRRLLGDEDRNTLNTGHRLAWTVANQGRWYEAEILFREVLDAKRRVHVDGHHNTLETIHGLAWSLANQGRWGEAETSFRELLSARRSVLGDDDPVTLDTYSDLAWTVAEQGRRGEAERAFREILDAKLRVLGSEHPSTRSTNQMLESYKAAG
jgi:transcriptional regulator with XRE-family HTH domain/tetratricopeptide (TPR) repeat protein